MIKRLHCHLKFDSIHQTSQHLNSLGGGSLGNLVSTASDCDELKAATAHAGHIISNGISSDLVGVTKCRGVCPRVPRRRCLIAHACMYKWAKLNIISMILLDDVRTFSPSFVVCVRNARIPISIVNEDINVRYQLRVSVFRQVRASRLIRPSRNGAANTPAESRILHMNRLHDRRVIKVSWRSDRVDACIRPMGGDAGQHSSRMLDTWKGVSVQWDLVSNWLVGRRATTTDTVSINLNNKEESILFSQRKKMLRFLRYTYQHGRFL